ncbi:MAG: D-alanine--D-alanine ligase [Candidatus Omnitrophota bacterium]|jgi:D-alanine-D-alanine ligase|nr:MAG: D-alanine--D-alanine ligase [Candidatus Omnitrophota bacterium]
MIKDKANFGRIGVLMGGPSSEREVSLKSGKAVFNSLLESGVDAVAIDISTDDPQINTRLINSYNIDCAFIALHGFFGEDGRIQAILDRMNIPFTGSGELASKLAIDKAASRVILKVNGINVPDCKVLGRLSYSPAWSRQIRLSFPLVVKPASNGSSIGLTIVDAQDGLNKAIELAFGYDEKILIEDYIKGRELTVGVLGEQALPVIEIVPKNRYFDFQAKYTPGMTEYIVPARINDNIAEQLKSTALKVHKLLGCSGCSRVDMILGLDNSIYVLELNSIPGFTPTSLLPKAARAAGIDFKELCLSLINMAYEKKQAELTARG